MKREKNRISVFFDKDGLLMGIPTAFVKSYNTSVGIDELYTLQYPYEERLEPFLLDLFARGNEAFLDKMPQNIRSPILKYKKARSYKAAVRDLGLVSIFWGIEVGYIIRPMWQDADPKYKGGYHDIKGKEITLPTEFEPGALAKAFLQAKEISPIGPVPEEPKCEWV